MPLPFVPPQVRLREIQQNLQQREEGQDDQELSFRETSEDLKALLVYCRAISIKPWSWLTQHQETTVSEMFSFGEPRAIELCRFSRGGCGRFL